MAPPPILSLALPSETGRVLSIQSHTVQVLFLCFTLFAFFSSSSKPSVWLLRKLKENENDELMKINL